MADDGFTRISSPMSKLFQAIRGMNDILPGESALWQSLETTVRDAGQNDYG